jgi:hypothetical protein
MDLVTSVSTIAGFLMDFSVYIGRSLRGCEALL